MAVGDLLQELQAVKRQEGTLQATWSRFFVESIDWGGLEGGGLEGGGWSSTAIGLNL